MTEKLIDRINERLIAFARDREPPQDPPRTCIHIDEWPGAAATAFFPPSAKAPPPTVWANLLTAIRVWLRVRVR